jgi:hypothetical protein
MFVVTASGHPEASANMAITEEQLATHGDLLVACVRVNRGADDRAKMKLLCPVNTVGPLLGSAINAGRISCFSVQDS